MKTTATLLTGLIIILFIYKKRASSTSGPQIFLSEEDERNLIESEDRQVYGPVTMQDAASLLS